MSDPTIKKVLLWIRSPSEKRQADQGRIFTIQEFKETLLFMIVIITLKFLMDNGKNYFYKASIFFTEVAGPGLKNVF